MALTGAFKELDPKLQGRLSTANLHIRGSSTTCSSSPDAGARGFYTCLVAWRFVALVS